MMETYAERLKREGRHQMTNYDMDELRRREQEKVERNLASADYDGCLGQTDEIERMKDREKRSRGIVIQESSSIEIDLDKGDALKLALQAHDKKVTLNQHIIDVLTDQLLDTKEVLRNTPRGKQELLKEY